MLEPPGHPETVGYSLLQTLSPGRSLLCTDASSNIVVLKALDDDCLYRQQLHPAIKDRLARVRDLPHARLATLRAVERWNQAPCVVWTWLDGECWDDTISNLPEDFGSLAAALIEAVDALHEMGIVHGSLHGRNIIVRADRQVWLSDVSPYLYTDPAADWASVVALLTVGIAMLPVEKASGLSVRLEEFQAARIRPQELSYALRGLMNEDSKTPTPIPADDRRYRRSSLLLACLLILAGFAFALGINWDPGRSITSRPTAFPALSQGQSN